jgi:HAD superfamily hydrolase (TIGR01509 family)
MQSIKTIILDFDGTLADCKALHQDGFRTAVKLYSDETFDNEMLEGRPTRDKVRILNSMGFNLDVDKINEHKQAHTQQNLQHYIKFDQELYDEIKRVSNIYNLCLSTNATESFILRSLDILKIKPFFNVINTATNFPSKPDPTTFINCINLTNSTPSTTVIFEDSPIGIAGAKLTKCHVVEVLDVKDTISKLKEF